MVEPIVEVKQGKLKGRILKGYKNVEYYSFQGIPYAKPPIGELRFKSPQPAEKWKGIRDATKKGNESIGKNFIHQTTIAGSEDCLFLNVYTPQLPKMNAELKLKPVMFWIHGGGFVVGSGNPDLFGPDYLIAKDVLLVTFNYRLGILGFLSLEDSSLGVPGNAGIRDMVLALKWVNENIIKFGGDPNNITIFGESAGAAAAHLIILSPMGKGLFQRAILQSGCAMYKWAYGSRVASQIAKALGLPNDNENEVLKYLQSISSEKIMEVQELINDNLKYNVTQIIGVVIEKPCDEPGFLMQDPMDIIKSGNYNKVPMIMGYTEQDGHLTLMTHFWTYGSIQVNLLKDLETKISFYYDIPNRTPLSRRITNKFKEFYFNNSDVTKDNLDDFLKFETDLIYSRAVYVTIQEHLKTSDFPIYFYQFFYKTSQNITRLLDSSTKGANHADDIGYIFKTEYLPNFAPKSKEEKAIENVTTMWTNFAKCSNPNLTSENVWKRAEKGLTKCFHLGDNFAFTDIYDKDRMEFMDLISADPEVNTTF